MSTDSRTVLVAGGGAWYEQRALHLTLLIALSAVLFGYGLGDNSLHNRDEAKYGVVAMNIVKSGDWLTLRFNEQPYVLKPPVRIWLMAAAFMGMGPSELAVRLASALFGAATIVVIYLLGRRLYGVWTAFLAAMILLTSHQYLYNHCARTGEMDSSLIFFTTTSFLLLMIAVERRLPAALVGAMVCIGLAGMFKHVTFCVILLAITAVVVLVSGNIRAFSPRAWLGGFLALACVILPWHLYQIVSQGEFFVQRYFFNQVLDKRLLSKNNCGARFGVWSSLVATAWGFFPWSCLLPAALAARLRWTRDIKILLPLVWLAVMVALPLISPCKLTWYVLPGFPPAAILIATWITDCVRGSALWQRAGLVAGGLLAWTSVTDTATHNPFATEAARGMIEVSFLERLHWLNLGWIGAVALFIGLACGLIVVDARWLSTTGRRWLAGSVAVSLILLATYNVMTPLEFSSHRSVIDRMTAKAVVERNDGESLRSYLEPRPYLRFVYRFYLERAEATPLRPKIDSDWSGLLITTSPKLRQLERFPLAKSHRFEQVAADRRTILVRVERKAGAAS